MPQAVQSQVIQVQRPPVGIFGMSSTNPFSQAISGAAGGLLNKGLDIIGLGYHDPKEEILKEQARSSKQESIRGMLQRGMDPQSVAKAMGMDVEDVNPYLQDQEVQNIKSGYDDIKAIKNQRDAVASRKIEASDPDPVTNTEKEILRADNAMTEGEFYVPNSDSPLSATYADISASVQDPTYGPEYQDQINNIRSRLTQGPERLQKMIEAKEQWVSYWDWRYQNALSKQNDRIQAAYNKHFTPKSMEDYLKNDMVAYDIESYKQYLDTTLEHMGVDSAELRGIPSGDVATAINAKKTQAVEMMLATALSYDQSGDPKKKAEAIRIREDAAKLQSLIKNVDSLFNTMSPRRAANLVAVLSPIAAEVGKNSSLRDILNAVSGETKAVIKADSDITNTKTKTQGVINKALIKANSDIQNTNTKANATIKSSENRASGQIAAANIASQAKVSAANIQGNTQRDVANTNAKAKTDAATIGAEASTQNNKNNQDTKLKIAEIRSEAAKYKVDTQYKSQQEREANLNNYRNNFLEVQKQKIANDLKRIEISERNAKTQEDKVALSRARGVASDKLKKLDLLNKALMTMQNQPYSPGNKKQFDENIEKIQNEITQILSN